MTTTLNAKLLKGAMLTGVINAFINGGIQYFFLKTYSSIAISVDSITNNEDTVLGTSVTLSITLAMILTMVAYFGIKEKSSILPNRFLVDDKAWIFYLWGINLSCCTMAKIRRYGRSIFDFSFNYYRCYCRYRLRYGELSNLA